MNNIRQLIKLLSYLIIAFSIFIFIYEINNKDIILGCGLFAFIGNNSSKYFNWDKFNILGIENDSRGGDACGRIMGNTYEHGTNLLSDYRDFIIENNNPIEKVEYHTILGHCRKASSGGKDAKYAQPIILKKSDLNMKAIRDTQFKGLIKKLDKDTIVFSGIHNGTVDNYKDLARKYGISTEDHNDSKVLLSILFYNNLDVLSEYIGTAALIWQNHIIGKTYVYKGASKLWDTSKIITEERPLFCWKVASDNYYLSSLEDSLKLIGALKDDVLQVKENTVYIFKDGINIKTIKIDRENCLQNKPYVSNYNKNKNINIAPYKRNELGFQGSYNNRDYYNSTYNLGELFVRKFNELKKPFRIQSEKLDSILVNNKVRKAVFNKGRYWMNGGLMHGIYALSPNGSISNRFTHDVQLSKVYYFIEGIMLDNFSAYNKVKEIHSTFMLEMYEVFNKEYSDPTYLEETFVMDIMQHSIHPTAPLTNFMSINDSCYDNIVDRTLATNFNYFSGLVTPLFSSRSYSYVDGRLISINDNRNFRTAVHTEDDANFTEWYLSKCKDGKVDDQIDLIGYSLINFELMANNLSPFQKSLISLIDTHAVDIDIDLFMLQYFRDFDQETKKDCRNCISENSTDSTECLKCKDFIANLNILTTELLYGRT